MFPLDFRVLVVDDMLTMRKMVMKACKDIGFKDFQTAKDGGDALEVIAKSDPPIQLIISDWNMPDVTGLEFLKKLRVQDAHKTTPFLMVTAESDKEQVLAALQAGVTNYVVKPFTVDTLRMKIEAMYKKLGGT